ncbi:DUF3037 domain-containing protein [Pseudomonas sp. Sample_24]|uniref:DUF3037 domain-containing protein n=1 Tax=Pseudomonas sp. Sample_24 TaxID=2448268 RepID=UPI001032EF40|nr:DUF3037 domain-containing protein [Pseudomonas sp. Sample_24]
MITFKYAVIKYMPDPKRGEIVNIGLVVFTDSKVDVRTLSASAKARILDGTSEPSDLDSLRSGLESIASWAKSPEQASQYLSAFGQSRTYLSSIDVFIIDDIHQYERRVSNLFNELVKPFSSKERVHRNSRLSTYLKNTFERMEILGKDSDDLSKHKIIHNYQLSDKTGFSADFLLKNGRFHITEAIDFNVNDTNSKFKETTMKVMTFMEGRKALGEDSARYFVYSASPSKEKEVVAHLNLAEEYSDKLFNIESKEEKTSYFTLMSELVGAGSLQLH